MDKKGWIRILEAFIAIVLISSIVVVLYVGKINKTGKDDGVYAIQEGVLDEIAADDGLRKDVLNNRTINIEKFVYDRVPPGFEVEIKICDPEQICELKEYKGEEGEEIYSSERLISSVVGEDQGAFNPKKLKIFMWKER